MLTRIIEIQVDLSRVGVRKLSELQVNNDETSQAPLEENQIDLIPLSPDSQTLLPRHEREIAVATVE